MEYDRHTEVVEKVDVLPVVSQSVLVTPAITSRG